MKALQVGIVIGIAFLLPLLAQMTVRFWGEPPKHNEYIEYQRYEATPKSAAERDQRNAEFKRKQEELEAAEKAFNLKSFYITFPLGILEIILAFAVRRKATVATGLFFGGLGTSAFTSFDCWDTLPGWLRYATLLLLLLILGVMAYLIDRSRQRDSTSAAIDH